MNRSKNPWIPDQEKDVDILSLIWNILYRWRLIILIGITFSILSAGLGYFDRLNEFDNINKQNSISSTDLKNMLSKDQLNTTNRAIIIQDQIKQREMYQANSVLMEIDAYKKNVVSIQYYVDNKYKVNFKMNISHDYTEDLIYAYITYIGDLGFSNKLASHLNTDIKSDYIGELISTNYVSQSANFVNGGKKIFTIYISGRNSKEANELADALEREINLYYTELSGTIGGHRLVKIGRSNSVKSDTVLANNQKDLINGIIQLQSTFDTLVANFNSTQKALISASYSNSEIQNYSETEVNSFYFLDFLKGFFLGALLCCIWLTIRYFIDNRLKSTGELEKLYNVQNFGYLTNDFSKKKVNIVDHWLDVLSKKEKYTLIEQQQLILAKIRITCKHNNINKIFIMSALSFNKKEKNMLQELMDNLKSNGIDVVFAENILQNFELLEQISNIKNVIVMEKLYKTKYNILEREFRLCWELKTDIIGSILFSQ